MKKTYITFGFDHLHQVSGKTFDHNCIAVILCDNQAQGRELAFAYFGKAFCMEYHEEEINDVNVVKYFPREFVEVNNHGN